MENRNIIELDFLLVIKEMELFKEWMRQFTSYKKVITSVLIQKSIAYE